MVLPENSAEPTAGVSGETTPAVFDELAPSPTAGVSAEPVASLSDEPVAEASDNNNNNEEPTFTLLPSDRKYTIGYDRIKGSRIWVQASADEQTIYHLFTLFEGNEKEDIYKCPQCKITEKKRNFCSIIKVKKLENGDVEVWECSDHYESCEIPLAKLESFQEKYHRTPKNSTPGQRSRTGASSTRTRRAVSQPPPAKTPPRRNRTIAAAATKKRQRRSVDREDIAYTAFGQPSASSSSAKTGGRTAGPSTNRSRTKATGTSSTKSPAKTPSNRSRSTVAATTRPQNRKSAEREDVDAAAPAKRGRKSAAAAANSHSSSDLQDSASVETVHPVTPMHQHYLARLHNASVATPSQAADPQPDASNETLPFAPRILKAGETFLHCIPSTDEFREMCASLNLEYRPEYQLFWHSTWLIDQITTDSRVKTVQDVHGRNIGFQALSAHFTSTQDFAFNIQEALKRHIGTTFWNEDPQHNNSVMAALCGFQLENIHLYALSQMLKLRIAVFADEQIEMFGDAFNEDIPSMLLQKDENGKLWSALTLR